MTIHDACPGEHPWYLDLRPDPAVLVRDADTFAALAALDAIGAIVLAVHTESLPTLAEIVAGRGYVGWSILVPGSVDLGAIEQIAAMAGTGYRATIAPGHPLPPGHDHRASLPIHRKAHDTALPSAWPHASAPRTSATASPPAGGA